MPAFLFNPFNNENDLNFFLIYESGIVLATMGKRLSLLMLQKLQEISSSINTNVIDLSVFVIQEIILLSICWGITNEFYLLIKSKISPPENENKEDANETPKIL